ncbi:MAG: 3'-5' exonuclease [Paracoccus denitrificans]|uniref:DNA-directed DNA polymerase n=1 Tax=Paracoccus denitrificans TaxID=266 RepID=A0A533IBL4_PARDE|nr:MAG: 3'-5' exonuclease [Paracoccus denitrificans]
MKTPISLRLRLFLLFAALALALLALLGLGLYAAAVRLGTVPGAAQGTGDALALTALIAGLGGLGLVTGVWYLIDTHIARPVETLSGRLLTGGDPQPDEGRYLGDLAAAIQSANTLLARTRADMDEALVTHAQASLREKALLENILSDIGAGVIMAGPQGRVLFYNAAAGRLLPGLGLDREVARFVRRGGLEAAQARLQAGADATDVALLGSDGARLTGRLRQMEGKDRGTILILRPAPRDMAQPGPALEALRRQAATLTLLLDDQSGPLPDELTAMVRDVGRNLAGNLRDLDAALAPSVPRQRHVAAEELARGLGLPLGEVAALTLAADGWQLGGLLSYLGARLNEAGRAPVARIRADGQEALVTLDWTGPSLPMDQLDSWLAEAPDPDHPEWRGADILAAHGTGIWPKSDGDTASLVLPIAIASTAQGALAGVTYDFALAARGAPDSRPLNALTCVVFDTETTGLSLSDRIVQIAGTRIAGGRLTGERFQTLVNPNRPIPPAATAIHGITDAMVCDAPDLSHALEGFHHFADDAVLIAHNAPFDMGLLRAAEAETGLHFANRVMDTVLLSAMIWGQSAPHSLDAICARLDINIPAGMRHTAPGDAEATAQAFLKMLPALEAKGITRFEHVLDQARKYRRLLGDANPTAAKGGSDI